MEPLAGFEPPAGGPPFASIAVGGAGSGLKSRGGESSTISPSSTPDRISTHFSLASPISTARCSPPIKQTVLPPVRNTACTGTNKASGISFTKISTLQLIPGRISGFVSVTAMLVRNNRALGFIHELPLSGRSATNSTLPLNSTLGMASTRMVHFCPSFTFLMTDSCRLASAIMPPDCGMVMIS